jgi:hypothetical protein
MFFFGISISLSKNKDGRKYSRSFLRRESFFGAPVGIVSGFGILSLWAGQGVIPKIRNPILFFVDNNNSIMNSIICEAKANGVISS